jgi:hypothetical protein
MMESFGQNMYCNNGTHFEWGNKNLCGDVTFIICIKHCNMQLEAAIFSSLRVEWLMLSAAEIMQNQLR